MSSTEKLLCQPTIHKLKTWPEYYKEVIKLKKTFEIRKNDRDFKVGDILILEEFDKDSGKYTGRQFSFRVTYLLGSGIFGVDTEFVVMSIKPTSHK